MFELLSGITEQDYRIRKSIISSVISSKIFIDWSFPIDLIYKAFDYVKWDSGYPRAIQKACENLATSTDLESAKKSLVSGNDSLSLNDLANMDKLLSNLQVEYFESSKVAFDQMFGGKSKATIYELLHNKLKDGPRLPDSLINTMENEKIKFSIFQLALAISQELDDKNCLQTVQDIYFSYNGSLRYYFEVSAYFFENRVAYNHGIKKNDVFDIAHFMYLKDSDVTKIVSDDKLVKEVCIALWPRKYISNDKLKYE